MAEALLQGGGSLAGNIIKIAEVLYIQKGKMVDDFNPNGGLIKLCQGLDVPSGPVEYESIPILDGNMQVIGYRVIPVYYGSLRDWYPSDGVFHVISDVNDTGEVIGGGFPYGNLHPSDPISNGISCDIGDGAYFITRSSPINQYEHTVKFTSVFYDHLNYASYYYVGPLLRSKTPISLSGEEILDPDTSNIGTWLGYSFYIHQTSHEINLWCIRLANRAFGVRFAPIQTNYSFYSPDIQKNGDVFETKIEGNKLYMKKNGVDLIAIANSPPYTEPNQTWIDLGPSPISGSKAGLMIGRWHFQYPMAKNYEVSWPSSSVLYGGGNVYYAPYVVNRECFLNGGGLIISIIQKTKQTTATLSVVCSFVDILLEKITNLITRISNFDEYNITTFKDVDKQSNMSGGGILNTYFISKVGAVINRLRRFNGLP